jgi:hypothetical protein
MTMVQIESVGPPFNRAPGAATLAFVLLIRAEAMGLLPSGVEGPTRLDQSLLHSLAAKLRSAGVATGSAGRLETSRGRELAQALRDVLDAIDASPYPEGEWTPMREILGDDLLSVLVGGISPSSLRRYATGARVTPDEVAWRLHILARIVAALRGSYNAYGIRQWFERRRPQLAEKTPGQVLVEAERHDDPEVETVTRLAETLLGPGIAT